MFRKPFNVKKNTNLRNSDIRKLLARIKEGTAEDVTLEKKSEVTHIKIENVQKDEMNIYSFDKIPMFFDFTSTGNIYPTVFFMKTHRNAFPVVIVHEQVLSYLENGADLMLPGIIRSGDFEVPEISRGCPITIALYSSGQVTGPVAVGCSLKSKAEMIACGFQGKGVQILHVFRDLLWEFGPRGQPNSYTVQEFLSVTDQLVEQMDEMAVEDPPVEVEHQQHEEKVEEEAEEVEKEDVNSLLLRCFLAGAKNRLKKSALPMDVGQFYTQCVLSCVPEGKNLDMKKTKYKKFGVFLQELNQHSGGAVVVISKKGKGADLIAEINTSHEVFKEFELTDEKITDDVAPNPDAFVPPQIKEYIAVTEPVLPLLKSQAKGIVKGSLLTSPQLRELLTAYVKSNELNNGKMVTMDPLLADASKVKTLTTDWNTLMQTVQSRMTKSWVIKWSDGREFVRKIYQPLIEFKIEKRASNKKVTLVNNLSVFGIMIKVISHQIQTGVATSVASMDDAVNCEGPQLVVQGNQIVFIADLLINTYGIEKKYIKGMELAPKKKQ